ncbi:TPA: hypothetical protein PXL60_004815 [Escherichia coli]|nr:hypothetical protein [Escherichia coli]
MALTPAERKANQMSRKAEFIDTLVATNAALTAENAKLRADLEAAREKMHKLQVNGLKAQIKAQG